MNPTHTLTDNERAELRTATIEIANLPDRIAANEEIHGPGCRPELRDRLTQAQATVSRLERVAADRLEHEARTGFDSASRPTFFAATLTDGGRSHLHWHGEEPGWTLCGANRWDADPMGTEITHQGDRLLWHVLDGRDERLCGRCVASARAWWNA